MPLSCLDNIVGLSPTNCICWDASKPVDFNTLNASSSGLYVVQPNTIPIRWVNGAADCENGGVWDLIISARETAIRDLLSDFLAATQQVKSEQFLPFTKIGDSYYKSAEIVYSAVAGVWLEPYVIRGAKLRIDSVDIAFFDGITGSTPVTIEVYSSLDLTTPITGGSAVATVTANKQYFTATFASPLIIELGEVRDDLNERFYIAYTIPVGARPVSNNTEKGCGCGKEINYINNPYRQILCLGGVQSDSIANVQTQPIRGTSTMQGLVINSSMECDYYSWLCDLAQQPNQATLIDGQRLRLGMALADAIRAKSVYNLAASILMSGRINHFTMILDPKQLYQIQNYFLKIYKAGIDNLVYHMPADVSDCLVCAKNKRMRVEPILA